jgi:hypothetical protein
MTETTTDPALEDFRWFLWEVWEYLGLPEPTPGQYELAAHLQGGPQQMIAMCQRGFGKSWILAAYCVWLLWKDNRLNILVVSASGERAVDFSQFCLRLLDMPKLAHLKPRDGDRQRMDRFDVHGAPLMQSANLVAIGVFGQLTGKRADIVVADDVEVPNTIETQGMREKLWRRTSEFTDLLKPEGPRRVIYLGTPHTEDSTYNRLARERGFEKWIWPATYPDDRLMRVYEGSLAPELLRRMGEASESLEGLATDPERFDDIALAEKRAVKTPSEWALQYLLDTSLSDYLKHPLRLSDLVVFDLDPRVAPEKVVWAGSREHRVEELPCVGLGDDHYQKPMTVVGDWLPYEMKLLAIDPSGRGQDETGWCVLGVLAGMIYLLDCGGIPEGYEETTLSQLAFKAKTYEVNLVVVEENFGNGMFTNLLRPHLDRAGSFALEEVRHSRQKELRICDTLEPVISSHKLAVSPKVIRDDYESRKDLSEDKRGPYKLFYQMARVSRDKGALHHDDRLDALAIGVDRMVTHMGKDQDKIMHSRHDLLLEEELEKDLEYLGFGSKGRGWLRGTRFQELRGRRSSREIPPSRAL